MALNDRAFRRIEKLFMSKVVEGGRGLSKTQARGKAFKDAVHRINKARGSLKNRQVDAFVRELEQAKMFVVRGLDDGSRSELRDVPAIQSAVNKMVDGISAIEGLIRAARR